MANVPKVRVWHVDLERNWPGMSEVNDELLPETLPVRSRFGATWFPCPERLLQIDCIAYEE